MQIAIEFPWRLLILFASKDVWTGHSQQLRTEPRGGRLPVTAYTTTTRLRTLVYTRWHLGMYMASVAQRSDEWTSEEAGGRWQVAGGRRQAAGE